MLDSHVAPSAQKRFVDPYQQRVFQYNTSSSDVFLSRVVNSVFKIFGDDIVITGFNRDDFDFTFTDKDIVVRAPAGMLIQDNTLLEISEPTSVLFENVNDLDDDGKLVVYTSYQFLDTIEENLIYLNINYVSKSGIPLKLWDHNKDRVILAILDFKKDEHGYLIDVQMSNDTVINIIGKNYYIFGLDPSREYLETYFLRAINKKIGSSLDLNHGISLINDVENPGVQKYYGTDADGVKGWMDLPPDYSKLPATISFTDLDDTPSNYGISQGMYLRVKKDGSGIEFAKTSDLISDNVVLLNKEQVITSDKIFDSNLIVLKNLVFKGSTVSVDQEYLSIKDNFITLNRDETGSGITLRKSGIKIERGTKPAAYLQFSEIDQSWGAYIEGDLTQQTFAFKSDIASLEKTKNDFLDNYSKEKYTMSVENGNVILTLIED